MDPQETTEIISINELAKEVSNNTQVNIKRTKYSISFGVVVIGLTLGVLSLAIIPTFGIVFSSSNITMEALSVKIINSVAINLTNKILDILTNIKHSNDAFLESPSLKTAMTTLTNGYESQEDTMRMAQAVLQNSPHIDRLLCVQKFNTTGNGVVSKSNNQIINLMSFTNFRGFMWNIWCDHSSFEKCFSGVYDFENHHMIPNLTLPDYIIPPREFLAYGSIYRELYNCGTGSWIPEVFFDFGYFTYVKCGNPTLFTCGSLFTTGYSLPAIFNKLNPTKNSKILFTDSEWNVISTNLESLFAPNVRDGKFLKIDNLADDRIREIGTILTTSKNVPFQNISAISINSADKIFTEITLSNNEKWMIVVTQMQFETLDLFYLVLAIPREDFFQVVDNSNTKALALSLTFLIVASVVGIGIIIAVLIPLRNLNDNLQKVWQTKNWRRI
ncbi:hypothetical protein HK098_004688 [Nowakowskiella sp. JEL0407]|nr:hypothetical protein HK098_004688 [Nowakowskiella sp. JEL0407]